MINKNIIFFGKLLGSKAIKSHWGGGVGRGSLDGIAEQAK